MAENQNVNPDTSNEDAGGQQKETENNSDNTELLQTKEQNRQLFERAKKAEAEVKELKVKLPKEAPKDSEPKQEAKKDEKSNEPDYGRLAYLNSVGVKHPDDIKAVQDEANRLKLSLTDVLQMEHIKSKLKTNQEARDAQDGSSVDSKRSGGNTQHDVDYWLNKGGLPEDNQELAEKVVNARMGKDSSQQKFAPIR